ncbi:MAG TPA: hypothetical protein VIH35_03515, partial [Kiritimatiellia bacterium]
MLIDVSKLVRALLIVVAFAFVAQGMDLLPCVDDCAEAASDCQHCAVHCFCDGELAVETDSLPAVRLPGPTHV